MRGGQDNPVGYLYPLREKKDQPGYGASLGLEDNQNGGQYNLGQDSPYKEQFNEDLRCLLIYFMFKDRFCQAAAQFSELQIRQVLRIIQR